MENLESIAWCPENVSIAMGLEGERVVCYLVSVLELLMAVFSVGKCESTEYWGWRVQRKLKMSVRGSSLPATILPAVR